MTALLLALALLAEEPRTVLDASVPAPPKSALTVWRFDGVDTPGLWLADIQEKRVAGELQGCREADATMVPGKVPWWVWGISGVLVGGVAGYMVKR